MGSFRLLHDSVSCLENMAGALPSSERVDRATGQQRTSRQGNRSFRLFRFILSEIQVFGHKGKDIGKRFLVLRKCCVWESKMAFGGPLLLPAGVCAENLGPWSALPSSGQTNFQQPRLALPKPG